MSYSREPAYRLDVEERATCILRGLLIHLVVRPNTGGTLNGAIVGTGSSAARVLSLSAVCARRYGRKRAGVKVWRSMCRTA